MRPGPIAAALAAIALVASCSQPRPRVDEVVFWQPWPVEVVAPVVREFEAATPGVRVLVRELPLESMGDSVDVARTAGSLPDLCVLEARDMRAPLASGVLSDWSAGVADLRDSLFGWPLCTVGDAIYGLPWLLRPRALVYNPSLFARAGLDTRGPAGGWTWAQVRAAATKLQALGHGVRGVGLTRGDDAATFEEFMSLAWGNEGELLSSGLDSSRLDSPGNREALEFLVSLRRVAVVMSADSLRDAFAHDRIGMLIGDGRVFRPAGAPRHFAVAPIPSPAAGRGDAAPFADGIVLASFTGSRHKEHALRLARHLVRPGSVLAIDGSTFVREYQPATVGADSAALFRDEPAARCLTAQCATARFAPHVARWDSVQAAVAEAVAGALAGRRSAAQALAEADARIGSLVSRR